MYRRLYDIKFMREALRLAAQGIGKTHPNPVVGAVVVKNGKIIGRGYHKKAGAPHAEILALKPASGFGFAGATLYVTLEPCSTYGKTPPCAPYIVEKGIKRIVVAAIDPNPKNRYKGINYLRAHGVKVETGVLEDEAIKLNEPYNKFITTGMPFVSVKAAISIDGKLATKTGSSKWISCAESRKFAGRLRRQADAVLIGKRTYLNDKPRFKGIKHKVVLGHPSVKGRVSLTEVMKKLAEMGIMHVLIEGGGETIASAFKEKLVDRLYVFIAPKIIGGRTAPTLVDGDGITDIKQALKFKDMKVARIGTDVLITIEV